VFSPSKHHSLPSLSQLREALLEMRGNLQTCRRFPTHVYPSHLSRCPWCERRSLWGFDPFPAPSLTKPPRPQFRPSKWLWIGLLVVFLIGLLVWFSRYL
jgi:hypothetical protein